METKEMYQLARWYRDNITDNGVEQSLRETKNKVTSMLSNGVEYSVKIYNIRNYLEAHIKVLSSIDLEALSFDDIEILEKLGLKYIVLSSSIPSLYKISNQGDVQEIAARISDSLETLESVNIQFTHFLDAFNKIFSSAPDVEETDHHGKVLTRVRFHNDALISNVVNLSDWTARWNTIARGYSMALGQAPETFEVVGASKGSIIFDLLLDFETVKLFSETFNLLAETAFNVAELYGAIKAVEFMKESNPDLYKQAVEHTKAEAEKKHEEMAEQVACKLLEKFQLSGQNTDGEVKGSLKRSVRELNNFVNKGGDINFRTESDEVDMAEQVSLVNDALKQLQHSSKQKQLEDKSQD
ncbi:hypothetical protein HPQ32_20200 [Photobacterium carnosum]|uniref:hypothetical protein n=1 Tax=Photobacterium carnosum TaxID=2023717 RepID=UPI001C91034A|nr:hypothetical protein [Photobacterium carnosum]MBY3790655.1 hypothetical protein [Photobacterium carnosum]MCD9496426.1 hypothetical protein [Photobacterium carnosum]MCD9535768.1 hypothetical protein [Photobacterium carnosum]